MKLKELKITELHKVTRNHEVDSAWETKMLTEAVRTRTVFEMVTLLLFKELDELGKRGKKHRNRLHKFTNTFDMIMDLELISNNYEPKIIEPTKELLREIKKLLEGEHSSLARAVGNKAVGRVDEMMGEIDL